MGGKAASRNPMVTIHALKHRFLGVFRSFMHPTVLFKNECSSQEAVITSSLKN